MRTTNSVLSLSPPRATPVMTSIDCTASWESDWNMAAAGGRLIVNRELRLRVVANRMEEPVGVGHHARGDGDLVEAGRRAEGQLGNRLDTNIGVRRRVRPVLGVADHIRRESVKSSVTAIRTTSRCLLCASTEDAVGVWRSIASRGIGVGGSREPRDGIRIVTVTACITPPVKENVDRAHRCLRPRAPVPRNRHRDERRGGAAVSITPTARSTAKSDGGSPWRPSLTRPDRVQLEV